MTEEEKEKIRNRGKTSPREKASLGKGAGEKKMGMVKKP